LMKKRVLAWSCFIGFMARPLKWKKGDSAFAAAVSGERVKRGQREEFARREPVRVLG